MKKSKQIEQLGGIIMMVAVLMISLGVSFQTSGKTSLKDLKIDEVAAKGIATNASQVIDKKENKEVSKNLSLNEVEMETAPASVLRIEV